MPEEAPVIRTTLPERFSVKMERRMPRQNLKKIHGGKKSNKVKKVKGGAARFKKPLMRSILIFGGVKQMMTANGDDIEMKLKYQRGEGVESIAWR
ncbi:hypothetical protein L6452_07386 [Arctium lappa]|uniref:Uncharacterized protein n=1 Tax=Arctium lappa TaxID=4217 RepID=A0ACB9EM11_ARCLA|nr:hypothetical protein L6452_07386 [Arctium lappa]